MDQETLKIYFAAYTDCWKLFKKYATLEAMEEPDYNRCVRDADNLDAKYRKYFTHHGLIEAEYNQSLPHRMIMNTLAEIDRIQTAITRGA